MVVTKSTSITVFDAGPIIHLDELDSLDLLIDFHKIIIPGTVFNEIKKNRPSALDRKDMFSVDLSESHPVNEHYL